jgi:hypothetical protein
LRGWINTRRREAYDRGTVAGGKYPTLCRCQNQLENICGDKLRVIFVDRPLEDSIASIIKRTKGRQDPDALAACQKWLWDGKEHLAQLVDPKNQIRVSYAEVLEDPDEQAKRIAEFCGLTAPTEKTLAKVREHVKPEMKSIKGQ